MEFDPGTFGALYADQYDARHDPGTTAQSVDLIADLAGSPDRVRMLELAIGTGRMALPLARRGYRIEGIDGSPEIIEVMRQKPGGADIPTSVGDMADVAVAGPFDFVFLVFNTLFNLTSQAAQVRLFRNVAARLAPGGRFLVETFVPDLTHFTDHQRMKARKVERDLLDYEAILHDPVEQVLRMQRLRITPDGQTLSPLVMRYAWPQEIDLMAEMAGMRRVARWSNWDRSPFTADSRMHITLYERGP